ncbi:MAG: flagellar M-ring protein FliF C-terminal domain-containing protein [Hyphomicrobiales bacterium]
MRRTLLPFLGLGNFQVSAVARLNADRSEQTETKYDPESRVERSVRTVREEGQSSNSASSPSVSVEQNLPDQAAGQAGRVAGVRLGDTQNVAVLEDGTELPLTPGVMLA